MSQCDTDKELLSLHVKSTHYKSCMYNRDHAVSSDLIGTAQVTFANGFTCLGYTPPPVVYTCLQLGGTVPGFTCGMSRRRGCFHHEERLLILICL